MTEKKTIEVELFHDANTYDGEHLEHVGFRNVEGVGKFFASLVPEKGMIRRVKLTIEPLDE